MKRLSKQDVIYSLLLLAVGMVIGWYGGQNKQADYEINIDQTHAYIKTTGTGEIQKVKHEELNDWFTKDNL